jgi:hypothetical protein
MTRHSARFNRNSPKCFLLGASWSHHPSWPRRLTHIYLGPFVLTITTTEEPR